MNQPPEERVLKMFHRSCNCPTDDPFEATNRTRIKQPQCIGCLVRFIRQAQRDARLESYEELGGFMEFASNRDYYKIRDWVNERIKQLEEEG